MHQQNSCTVVMYNISKTTRLLLSVALIFAFFATTDAAPTTDPSQTNITIPESCENKNEETAALELDDVCQRCAKHTGNPDVKNFCSDSCYSTKYVPACVKMLCKWDEKDKYRKWVEDLSGNKFAVWESPKVRLLDESLEVTEEPLHHSIETRSTDGYCDPKYTTEKSS